MPVMLVVANYDEIAPPPAMDRVAKRVRGRVEVLRLDVGHFDIYVGDPFEQSVKAQAAFLRSL
jgi:poly(3-hydroxyalkanoate) synthetase